MACSKVNKQFKKPVKWWFHKIMCELSYKLYGSGKWYYLHLNKLCDLGFNLYGEPFLTLDRPSLNSADAQMPNSEAEIQASLIRNHYVKQALHSL